MPHRVHKFTAGQLLSRPDSHRVLDANGHIRLDHPHYIADPVFATIGRDGTIRMRRQSEVIVPAGAASAGGPVITVAKPGVPADSGNTRDFSKTNPYIVYPFDGDLGGQRQRSDCFSVAVGQGFADLAPDVVFTHEKQIGNNLFQSSFWKDYNFNAQTMNSRLDIQFDGTLSIDNGDDVSDDGSWWLKAMTQYVGFVRSGVNTIGAGEFGFGSEVMLMKGVWPSTYGVIDTSIFTTIMSALSNSLCVIASTMADTGNSGLIGAHVYIVKAVRPNLISPELSEVDLDNTWKGQGIVTVRWAQLKAGVSSITVGTKRAFTPDAAYTPWASPSVIGPAIPLSTPALTFSPHPPTIDIWWLPDSDGLELRFDGVALSGQNGPYVGPNSVGWYARNGYRAAIEASDSRRWALAYTGIVTPPPQPTWTLPSVKAEQADNPQTYALLAALVAKVNP